MVFDVVVVDVARTGHRCIGFVGGPPINRHSTTMVQLVITSINNALSTNRMKPNKQTRWKNHLLNYRIWNARDARSHSRTPQTHRLQRSSDFPCVPYLLIGKANTCILCVIKMKKYSIVIVIGHDQRKPRRTIFLSFRFQFIYICPFKCHLLKWRRYPTRHWKVYCMNDEHFR